MTELLLIFRFRGDVSFEPGTSWLTLISVARYRPLIHLFDITEARTWKKLDTSRRSPCTGISMMLAGAVVAAAAASTTTALSRLSRVKGADFLSLSLYNRTTQQYPFRVEIFKLKVRAETKQFAEKGFVRFIRSLGGFCVE